MSFLWHGLTEQGAQVPVQVDAQGRVIAVDGTPGVSNWERTGTTLSPAVSGDSVSVGGTTSAPNITLNASGSGRFAGDVQIAGDPVAGAATGVRLRTAGIVTACRTGTNKIWVGSQEGKAEPTSFITADGAIAVVGTGTELAPNISLNADGSIVAQSYIRTNHQLATANSSGAGGTPVANFLVYDGRTNGLGSVTYSDGTTRIGGTLTGGWSTDAPNITLNADGSATFAGNVTAANITFRSADPSFYVPNERSESYDGDTYTGPELNLLEEIVRLEALVKHLYDVLRQNPPAGWDVWDGDTDLIKSRGRRHQQAGTSGTVTPT